MKNTRQRKILEIIEKYDIDTQEALISKLSEIGIYVTQTTISRDIRQLKLVKGLSSSGMYKYISPGANVENNIPSFNSAFTDSIVSIESAMNIVVVKTFPGMANALAVCIENLHPYNLVGSVAGDDTILLVMRNIESAISAEEKLKISFGVN